MSISRLEIEKIFAVGGRAISGYNSQPWRFLIEHDQVSVFLPRTKNFMLKLHGVTPMTLGFLLENLDQGAQFHGYHMEVLMLDAPSGLDTPFAKLRFRADAATTAPDIAHVLDRRTNRFAYRRGDIPTPTLLGLERLKRAISDDNSQLHVLGTKKRVLGEILADLEVVRFRNIRLIEEVANYVHQQRSSSAAATRDVAADTLDLTPLQTRMLALFKRFPRARRPILWLNAIGLWRKVRAFCVHATAGYLVFTVSNEKDATYVELGRKIQRSLNELTRLGLASHSMLSGLYLLHLCFENPEIFSTSAKNTLLVCRQDLERMFGVPDRHIAFIVRFGYPSAPVALTPRRPVASLLLAPTD